MKPPAAEHYLTPWSIQRRGSDRVITAAKGCYLIDRAGKQYFDMSSGWVCANLGYGNSHIAEAIGRQAHTLSYASPHLTTEIREEYAGRLCERAPWPQGSRVHFTCGGADANDDAIRTARQLTGRTKVRAAYRSYHGHTSGSAALTGGSRRWAIEPSGPTNVVHFFTPTGYGSPFHQDGTLGETARALAHLETVIELENPTNIAALIIELVLGSDGLVAYPAEYLRGIRALAAHHGLLLVHDEVMCGFGRVGEVFASMRLDVAPDIITFAKGVTGAHIPLGGVLVREDLAAMYDDTPFPCGHTYSGHPVAMAAAIAALEEYDRGQHFSSAYQIENWLRDGLSELQSGLPVIRDVRGAGAFFGVELINDRSTDAMGAFSDDLMRSGVSLYHRKGLCVFAPPLISSEDDVRSGIDQVGRVLRRHQRQLIDS